MNAITSRIAPSTPQAGLQGTGSAATNAPTATSTPLDTEARHGSGPFEGCQVAVGDGQATQRLHDAHLAAQLSSVASDIEAKISSLPANHGLAGLKERQLSHGDGQATARSRGVGAAILHVLSSVSNLLKTLLQTFKISSLNSQERSAVAQWEKARADVKNLGTLPHDALAMQKAQDRLTRATEAKTTLQRAIFDADVTQLTGVLAKDPMPSANTSAAESIHTQAVKDWKRDGVTINGTTFSASPENDNVRNASTALSAACGKPMAQWTSRFANQQVFVPLSKLIGQQPLGPDGETDFLPGGLARQMYTITVLPDTSVQIDLYCSWDPLRALSTSRNDVLDILELDEGSSITAQFSLRLEMPSSGSANAPPTVSILRPLELTTDIRHSADQ